MPSASKKRIGCLSSKCSERHALYFCHSETHSCLVPVTLHELLSVPPVEAIVVCVSKKGTRRGGVVDQSMDNIALLWREYGHKFGGRDPTKRKAVLMPYGLGTTVTVDIKLLPEKEKV
ncbi:hypothetical protein E2542_SST01359 [Spatholobus suberectus]|nr:hypothetical protein E2542_SST01359 [Spatholobus suberectus]